MKYSISLSIPTLLTIRVRHFLAIEVDHIKRGLTVVKTVVVEYGMEDREKFIQVTVPAEGAHLLWLVVRRARERCTGSTSSSPRRRGKEIRSTTSYPGGSQQSSEAQDST